MTTKIRRLKEKRRLELAADFDHLGPVPKYMLGEVMRKGNLWRYLHPSLRNYAVAEEAKEALNSGNRRGANEANRVRAEGALQRAKALQRAVPPELWVRRGGAGTIARLKNIPKRTVLHYMKLIGQGR